eukprot:scaffold922_cov327-Pinguiococcus_pyrenoidosus.AAC.36
MSLRRAHRRDAPAPPARSFFPPSAQPDRRKGSPDPPSPDPPARVGRRCHALFVPCLRLWPPARGRDPRGWQLPSTPALHTGADSSYRLDRGRLRSPEAGAHPSRSAPVRTAIPQGDSGSECWSCPAWTAATAPSPSGAEAAAKCEA